MTSESIFHTKNLVAIIPLIYAASICIAVVNLLGYYQYFDAIWILKEFSVSYILIYSAGFFFAIITGFYFAYQIYRIRLLNQKEFSFKDLIIKSTYIILIILFLIGVLFYIDKINSEIIVFFSLYTLVFIANYTYLAIHDKSYVDGNFRSQIKIQMAIFMFVVCLTSGYYNAKLKFYLEEFYTVNLKNNSEKFHLLETIGDKAIIFTLDSSPPKKMKYKIVDISDLELIYKD
ncbi:hypothetical protein [Acinetobacter sp. HR7]|uniref:hypothetical protein n=1 Tax=Acinetobacter sp. HR7 TaxID=1509403 RepID=UPI0005387456|nr:hypothetical protein [Acinetobacter sp. HR7]KGT48228.1 hypothetical protein GW12_07310 [Acinetobacter sp. HR7]